jgi:tRNA (cytidine/uridine-2'-O-)-methyltransferase
MSSHASKSYLETDFQDGDWLVLVKSKGLSQVLTVRKSPNYSYVPTNQSFNIANSVAFVIGESKSKFERLNYKLPFQHQKQYARL